MRRLKTAVAVVLVTFSLNTLAAASKKSYTDADVKCLAQTIHHEAQGESRAGKIAVGQVVLNRTKNPKFPSTVCNVVKQKSNNRCQFSWYCTSKRNEHPAKKSESYIIARDILLGGVRSKAVSNALFFHSGSKKWEKTQVTSIGGHTFYK